MSNAETTQLCKNSAQNLNDFNLIGKLSEVDMVVSDIKYHLNCLISRYRQKKKINRTHCDELVDSQIMKCTLSFSFCSTTSTKFEVVTLTNLAHGLISSTSLFQIFPARIFLTNNFCAKLSQFINFYLKSYNLYFQGKNQF